MMVKDPLMLMSIINTKLRDQYDSLDDLCSSEDESREDIERILNSAGYYYKKELNQFKKGK